MTGILIILFLFLGDKKKFSIHVRFCNDKCRRTWTPCVEYFFSEEELFEKHPNTVVRIFF